MPNWTNNDKSYLYYDFMTRDFLKFISELDKEQKYWSAPGSGQRVYKTGNFQDKAKSSYNDAVTAINYETDKKPSDAGIYWRRIFGSFFED